MQAHIPSPVRGILFLLGAVLLFAILDTTAKYLTRHAALALLVWGRYATHLLLMLILLAPRRDSSPLLRAPRPGLQVLRGLLLLGCTGFNFAALSYMPVAETTAVFFTAPLLVALLAGPWLGEKLTPGRWLAALAGFAGILLIARPAAGLTPAGIVLALGGAGCYACYQLLTRQLAEHTPPLTLLFYTALVGTLGASLVLPWCWPAAWPATWIILTTIALGMLGGSGHLLLIHAFRNAPASFLSPFLYTQLIWATLLGAIVFQHWPDAPALSGMAIIALSGAALGWHQSRPKDQKPVE